MDFMNTPEQFAHIPKDILRDRRMTLAAKGLYSVICTFGPDSPVSITAVAELLGLAGGGDRPYLGRDGLLHAAQGEGRRAFPCYGRDAAGTGRFPELTSGKYQQTGSFSDWNCLFLFYKNPLYFQSGYAILGMYLGNYKYYAIQNIIVYKTKGANLYETDGR